MRSSLQRLKRTWPEQHERFGKGGTLMSHYPVGNRKNVQPEDDPEDDPGYSPILTAKSLEIHNKAKSMRVGKPDDCGGISESSWMRTPRISVAQSKKNCSDSKKQESPLHRRTPEHSAEATRFQQASSHTSSTPVPHLSQQASRQGEVNKGPEKLVDESPLYRRTPEHRDEVRKKNARIAVLDEMVKALRDLYNRSKQENEKCQIELEQLKKQLEELKKRLPAAEGTIEKLRAQLKDKALKKRKADKLHQRNLERLQDTLRTVRREKKAQNAAQNAEISSLKRARKAGVQREKRLKVALTKEQRMCKSFRSRFQKQRLNKARRRC